MTSTRRGRGPGSGGRMWTGGGGSSPMWTSTQKIKIKSPLTSYCLLLMQRSWRLFYQNFIFGPKKVEIFLRCKLVIGYSLNKFESYSRISDLGPVGHCTSHFKRAVCISCRPRVDVHKWGGGVRPCGRMWTGRGRVKNLIFCR